MKTKETFKPSLTQSHSIESSIEYNDQITTLSKIEKFKQLNLQQSSSLHKIESDYDEKIIKGNLSKDKQKSQYNVIKITNDGGNNNKIIKLNKNQSSSRKYMTVGSTSLNDTPVTNSRGVNIS